MKSDIIIAQATLCGGLVVYKSRILWYNLGEACKNKSTLLCYLLHAVPKA